MSVATACDDECETSFEEDRAPLPGLLNPQNLECDFSYGGGGGGGGTCGNFGGDQDPGGLQAPQPDWAYCDGNCEWFDEATCLTEPACRAAYQGPFDTTPGGGSGDTYTFLRCLPTAPSGPIQGGGCEGLDAYECSRHDDCSARHDLNNQFVACVDETVGCYSDDECGPGETCNASDVCLSPPGCELGGACPDVCYGYCVPDGQDPGSCVGEVACDEEPPECPPGTVAGRTAACWTGYCIPEDQCDQPPTCDGLSEQSCVASTTCDPIYLGSGCTCDAMGCSCTDWTYSRCE